MMQYYSPNTGHFFVTPATACAVAFRRELTMSTGMVDHAGIVKTPNRARFWLDQYYQDLMESRRLGNELSRLRSLVYGEAA